MKTKKDVRRYKMKNKYVYGSLVIAIVAVLGISMVFASGMNNFNKFGSLTEEEKVAMQEQKEAYQTAVENEDYAAWEAIMLDRVSDLEDKITRENFKEIVTRHAERNEFRLAVEELKESGEFSREALEDLKIEYGIESKGFGEGKDEMHKKGMRSSRAKPESCPFTE
jgi:hypothetical protein